MKTINKKWLDHFKKEMTDTNIVRIVSPFISDTMVKHLLDNRHDQDIMFITRYNLNDFRSGVSSIKALEKLLQENIKIKGIKGLHSKAYIFDTKSAIITSANFTSGGFFNNYEFGIITHDIDEVKESIAYFSSLWEVDNEILTQSKIDEFKKELGVLVKAPAMGKLKDYGTSPAKKVLGDRRYFVKFFGSGSNRETLEKSVKSEVEASDCYFALTFPKGLGRPRRYRDGDVVFVARMVEGDYAIFGRTIARKHEDDRDFASPEDIKEADFKIKFPIYIRVHSGEFLDTTFEHCPMLQKLMSDLLGESFRASKERMQRGETDLNPRSSLMQKPDIELSEEGAMWLEQEFKEAKEKYGLLSNNYIESLYQGIPIVK